MFLDYYKLEMNPFATRQVRPRLESHSSRHGLLRLEKLLDGQIHCLFLSGPANVGKSTLADRRLRDLEEGTLSLIGPTVREPEAFLLKILSDLGLQAIEASTAELRNILQVYLQHQAANGRRSVLVIDGLERIAAPVLRELEWLMDLRFRNLSVIHFVLLTRSENIVSDLMPTDKGGQLAPFVHQRLTGFSLEETRVYLSACFESVGCSDIDGMFPHDVVVDIQAFTRGIVGDVNALCFEVLNVLAKQYEGSEELPVVSRDMFRDAGKKLHLNYDATAWDFMEEALSPESVHQFKVQDLQIEAARLFVSSKGRVVAEVSLDRPRMILGRDDDCDISLDSSYVSRYQNLFMETEDGWMLIDLNSTNGCYVNGNRVREHRLQDGDIIAVGHHQLSFIGTSSTIPSLRELNTSALPESFEVSPSSADTLVRPGPVRDPAES
ncbi:MAG: FHA domain-containing protein [Candidatus Rariloculaceae bacterium]